MPNVNAPYGLRPVRRLDGAPFKQSAYTIAGGYNTSIFTGQLVRKTGTGRNIEVIADTQTPCGVFAGCKYVEPDGTIKYSRRWPASQVVKAGTVVEAYVIDDPQVLFEIQASAGFALADIGQFAGLVVGTGNNETGQAASALNSADITGTLDNFLIYELSRKVGNEVGNFANVLVLLARHELRDPLTGV